MNSSQDGSAGDATQAAQELLLAELVGAIESEHNARGAVFQARSRKLDTLLALQEAGVSMAQIAHRLERSQGRVPTLQARLRVAASLRKQLSRAGVTRRHAVQHDIDGTNEGALLGSERNTKQAATMPEPKLLKRTTTTTTEEFADDLDLDEADDLDGLTDDEEREPEERKAPDSADERSRRRK